MANSFVLLAEWRKRGGACQMCGWKSGRS